MHQNVKNGMFFIAFGLLAEFTSAEAAITCNVTQETDGFRYRLSQPPLSSDCTTCWESKNKTVMALNSDFGQHVRSLTNQSITMKECHSYLRYTRDCQVWEEAQCEINCSHISDLKDILTTKNSTLICITESFCLPKLIFGLLVFLVFIVVCVLVALLCCNNSKCRRRESATGSVSYTPANDNNNMELEEMKVVTLKT